MTGRGFTDLIKKLDGDIFDLLSNFNCSICHNIFNGPVSTKCGHIFCGVCIRRVLSNKNNSGCPLCKTSVNRRNLVPEETQLLICDALREIPAAFKSDVEDLSSDFNKSIDDLSGCKTFEFCSPSDDKKKGRKGRNSGNKTEKDNFVAAVRKSTNVIKYSNKKKEVDDLVSVSQMEPSDNFTISTGSYEKNLESVEKVPPEEKINNWLEIAGENLFNNPNTSILKIDEPKPSTSMVRVDYNKDKNDSDDPYEFVPSQTNYIQKKKRGRKPIPNKKVYDFQTLQSFTKESVKRSQLNLQEEKEVVVEKECLIKFDEEALDEILSPEKIPDTLKVPTLTASQRFEHLLEETKEDRTNHVLYSPKSDHSLLCSLESELPNPKKPESKDSSDLSDLGMAELFSTPKQKRKKSSEGGAKKKSRKIEVLEDISNDAGAKKKSRIVEVSEDKPGGVRKISRLVEVLDEIKEDRELLAKNLSEGNMSSFSRSPGWSRVSGLKSDFEKLKRGRPKKLKSLNISGGEKALNASKSNVSVVVDENIKNIESLAMKNGDDYIEDLSQASEFMTGFSSQGLNEDEKNFRKMVENMEEELNFMMAPESSSGEIIPETESEGIVKEIVAGRKMMKAPEKQALKMRVDVPSPDAPARESATTATTLHASAAPSSLINNLAPVFNDITPPIKAKLHVPENLVIVPVVPETPVAVAPETPIPVVPETPVAIAPETPITVSQPPPLTSTPVVPQTKRQRLAERRKSRGTIPFTISGRIKKKKQSSTILISLGKLVPYLRSKSTTVKLVIPNRTKSQRSRINVGIQKQPEIRKIRDSFAQTSQTVAPTETHSVGVQMTQVEKEQPMQSVGVQSSQAKKVASSAQTSQLEQTSVGVQMTQVENVTTAAQTSSSERNSIGVQMTQVQNVTVAAQTSESDRASIGVQMTQVRNASAAAQTSQSPLSVRSTGIQMTQVKNVATAAQTSGSPLLTSRLQLTQLRYPSEDDKSSSQVLPVSSQESCKDLYPSIPSEALRRCERESEWEEIENLDQMKSQPDEKVPTQPEVPAKEDSILLDPEMEVEFNTTWQKITQKKTESQKQKNLRDYFSPGRSRKVRRISSGDLNSPVEVVPEKFEGPQLIPLNVEKITVTENLDPEKVSENETIDLEASQKNTPIRTQDVLLNIDEDLSRIRKLRTEDEEKLPKSQGEESDSDIFVEQTPPRLNSSRILEMTQRSPKEVQNTEYTEIIADSIPAKEIEKSIANEQEFKTPPRPKILKTPHLGFPSKESFFRKEETDENDQNNINNEHRTSQMKAIMQSWKTPAKKPPLIIASSSVPNGAIIKKFVETFKCEFATSVTKDVTHLIVGLHPNENDENLPLLTPKFLFALAYKKWIVTEGWIEACLKAKAIVPESGYESPDTLGGDSCKRARLSMEPLFKNFEIHMHGDFEKITKEDLGKVLTACGAEVVQHPTHFSFRPTKIRIIIVDKECNDYEVDEMSALFKKFKTAVLSREYVVTAIECYRLVNFTPYLMTLTSEDELSDMGYPYHLAKHEEESEAMTYRGVTT